MSKKSRKRNKKILAALALAGGAAMLAKGRGKGTGAVTGVVNPNAPKSNWISKKADVVAPVIPSPDGSGGGGIHQGKTKPFQSKWHGVAPAPPGILNPYSPQRQGTGPRRFHKGGGIAKRGTGQALRNGGHVKSMGIAKRGGGAAKR